METLWHLQRKREEIKKRSKKNNVWMWERENLWKCCWTKFQAHFMVLVLKSSYRLLLTFTSQSKQKVFRLPKTKSRERERAKQFSMSPSRLPCRHDYDPPCACCYLHFFDFLFLCWWWESGVIFTNLLLDAPKKIMQWAISRPSHVNAKMPIKFHLFFIFQPLFLRNIFYISEIPLCSKYFYSFRIGLIQKLLFILFDFFFGGDDDDDWCRPPFLFCCLWKCR